jgi:hypothetical protein
VCRGSGVERPVNRVNAADATWPPRDQRPRCSNRGRDRLIGGHVVAPEEVDDASLPKRVGIAIHQQAGMEERRKGVTRIQTFDHATERQRRRRRNDRWTNVRSQQPRRRWAEVRKRDQRSPRIVETDARELTTRRRQRVLADFTVHCAEAAVIRIEEDTGTVRTHPNDRACAIRQRLTGDEQRDGGPTAAEARSNAPIRRVLDWNGPSRRAARARVVTEIVSVKIQAISLPGMFHFEGQITELAGIRAI